MAGFSADWLALREPADARARSVALTDAVSARLRDQKALRVLDLAAGTGANVRYLAQALPGDRQDREWLLVDNDAALLGKASAGAERIVTHVCDLATGIESAGGSLCTGRDLVTASALLDLVSEPWLDRLVRSCRAAGSMALFALTYNGDIRCEPEAPEDALVRDLVNWHQQNDKGFGRALGPAASQSAARLFDDAGYEVRAERSDWVLGAEAEQLQTQLIEGWAAAAEEISPDRSPQLRGWRARRLAHITAGESRIIVGHEDLAAWLPGR
jgi:hypothetical protein